MTYVTEFMNWLAGIPEPQWRLYTVIAIVYVIIK